MIFRILFFTTIFLTALELVRPRFVIANLNLEWFLAATVIGSVLALGAAPNPGAKSFPLRLILTLVVFVGSMVVAQRIFAELGRTGGVVAFSVAVILAVATWMEIRKV